MSDKLPACRPGTLCQTSDKLAACRIQSSFLGHPTSWPSAGFGFHAADKLGLSDIIFCGKNAS
jgi:hypothetical protein